MEARSASIEALTLAGETTGAHVTSVGPFSLRGTRIQVIAGTPERSQPRRVWLRVNVQRAASATR